MKKIISLVVFFLLGLSAFAQQNKKIILPDVPNRPKYVDYSNKLTGWWCAVQANAGFAATNKADHFIFTQFDFINGYRFSEFFRIGLGLSPRVYFTRQVFSVTDTPKINSAYSVPIYLDLRGNFISQEDRVFAPYWNLDFGYSVREGFFLSPGIGIRFGGMRNDFLVGISYTAQDYVGVDYLRMVHILALRIGYEF